MWWNPGIALLSSRSMQNQDELDLPVGGGRSVKVVDVRKKYLYSHSDSVVSVTEACASFFSPCNHANGVLCIYLESS
jgi:hypothetical protein